MTSNSCGGDDDDDAAEQKVARGWLTIYVSNNLKSPCAKLSARLQLLNKTKELRERYHDDNLTIIFTGQSLGASLSVLSAFGVAENVVPDLPVTAFVFGCLQIGNKAFNQRTKKHKNLKSLHVKNTIDLIPHYPGELLRYVYTGTELVLDSRKSTSLKDSNNHGDWHNLQGILHIVAGWNREKEEFKLKVNRSVALVN